MSSYARANVRITNDKNKRKIPMRASRGLKWENKMYKVKRSIGQPKFQVVAQGPNTEAYCIQMEGLVSKETVVPGHVGGEVRHENLVSRQVDKCKTSTIKIYRS